MLKPVTEYSRCLDFTVDKIYGISQSRAACAVFGFRPRLGRPNLEVCSRLGRAPLNDVHPPLIHVFQKRSAYNSVRVSTDEN